ncbi:MAG: leucyl/phenylalanyl-tRNA--protein transferase [Spirochaetia bacterium]|nr:leucyl/phenylalanyl-tRNA--protein transferase [Spirochaetia bacterium]
MSVYWLTSDLIFPDVNDAEPDGLLAVGGDLSLSRLKLAYQNGIFPWYNENPVLWFSPNPRMVLFLDDLKIHRSLRKILSKNEFIVTFNKAFKDVIKACASSHAHKGTWINPQMIEAYIALHQAGMAVSVECWQKNQLVGGLYGVCINNVFCGESMFHLVDNASKVALVHLVRKLASLGFTLLDSQVYTENMARFGAKYISRNQYLAILRKERVIPAYEFS